MKGNKTGGKEKGCLSALTKAFCYYSKETSEFLLLKISPAFQQNVTTSANLLFFCWQSVSPNEEQPRPAPAESKGSFPGEREPEDALPPVLPLAGDRAEDRLPWHQVLHALPRRREKERPWYIICPFEQSQVGRAGSFIFSLGEGKEQILSGLDSRCRGSTWDAETVCLIRVLRSGEHWALLLTGASGSTYVCTGSHTHADGVHGPTCSTPRSIVGSSVEGIGPISWWGYHPSAEWASPAARMFLTCCKCKILFKWFLWPNGLCWWS